jgi:single-strand DNA-binding protein
MTNTNLVALVGRLTRDAELKVVGNGFSICNFSIAVNRSVKDGDKWADKASFFDCKLLGKYAESMNARLIKGTQIVVTGELEQDRWEKGGEKHSRVVILANRVELMGSKPTAKDEASEFSDDIPF